MTSCPHSKALVWNALVLCIVKRIAQKVTHTLMRDAAELFQQPAMKSKVRSQHLGDRECEVSMRHGREDRLRQHRAEYFRKATNGNLHCLCPLDAPLR